MKAFCQMRFQLRLFLAPSVILALVFGCKGPDLADALTCPPSLAHS